jgi:molybdopterin-containing oxidoreductase family iron-sulfur binding subunit
MLHWAEALRLPQLNGKLQQAINKVAADLKNANGAALVVARSNDVNVQTIINAINQQIGAYGKTIDWSVLSITARVLIRI